MENHGDVGETHFPSEPLIDVTAFCEWLSEKEGVKCHLPTEAQWEYACRANTSTALNNGTNLASVEQDANMDLVGRYSYNSDIGFSGDQGVGLDVATAKVGSCLPNEWGLYDMHGNVWERCLDWYGTYPGTVTDPTGSASGTGRVMRGGCWRINAGGCRSASRGSPNPKLRYFSLGFRLLRIVP